MEPDHFVVGCLSFLLFSREKYSYTGCIAIGWGAPQSLLACSAGTWTDGRLFSGTWLVDHRVLYWYRCWW